MEHDTPFMSHPAVVDMCFVCVFCQIFVKTLTGKTSKYCDPTSAMPWPRSQQFPSYALTYFDFLHFSNFFSQMPTAKSSSWHDITRSHPRGGVLGHHRYGQVQDPGQGGHPSRSAASHFRWKAAWGWKNTCGLQHPEGVHSSPCLWAFPHAPSPTTIPAAAPSRTCLDME